MGISRAQALDSVRSDDLIGIGMEAAAVRRKLHPEGVVSYAIVGRVDCAHGDAGRVRVKAEDCESRGASGVILTGLGQLNLEHVASVIQETRRALPDTWICGLTAIELNKVASAAGAGLSSAVERLREAGWDSLSAESPNLLGGPRALDDWFAVQRAVHGTGVRTTASLRFGVGEGEDERVEFLERVAGLQNETGGFVAFAPENAGTGLNGPTAVKCVKLIAISRLMLDGIPTIEAGRATASLKVLETMLRFGADDAGEIVLQPSSPPDLLEENLRRVIRDAGFSPVERDLGYRAMFVA